MQLERKKLLLLLSVLSRIIPAKSALPFTENILFTSDGKTLTLRASDSNNDIITTLPLVCEEVSFSVPSVTLQEILKTITDETVEMSLEGGSVKIKWSTGNASMPDFGTSDWKPLPPYEKPAHFSAPGEEFINGLSSTLYAVSNDELRPAMCSILLNFSAEGLDMVTSDSRTLVRYPIKDTQGEGTILLPDKIARILKTIPDIDRITFCCEANSCELQTGTFTIRFIPVAGKYPNYKAVIPTERKSELSLAAKTFLQSVKRVAICASELTLGVKLHMESDLSGGHLTISSDSTSGKMKETLDCSYTGEPMDICFKAPALEAVLQNTPVETIMLQLTDKTHPVLFVDADEKSDIQGILVPIREA